MAIAEMIRIIATTINSSISEKPFCFFMSALKMITQCPGWPSKNGSRTVPQTRELYHHKSFAFKEISCLDRGRQLSGKPTTLRPALLLLSKHKYAFRDTRIAFP